MISRLLAEGLHQVVAHPLLFLTRGSRCATWLHDATAAAAWPAEDPGAQYDDLRRRDAAADGRRAVVEALATRYACQPLGMPPPLWAVALAERTIGGR